jgi:Phosphodiester glycosidase
MKFTNRYKIAVILSILLFAFLVACYFVCKNYDVKEQLIRIAPKSFVEDTIQFKQITHKYNNRNIQINFSRVKLGRVNIGVRNPQSINPLNKDYNGYTLKEYFEFGSHEVVQSGGFFYGLSPPTSLGLVKIKNQEYSSTHKSWLTTGLFCSNGKNVIIGDVKEVNPEKWISCLQAGHLVLKNGKNVMNIQSNTWHITGKAHTQSFACMDEDNSLVLGVSGVISLKVLVQDILSKPKKMGGIGCINAVVMSGGSTAGMMIKLKNENKVIGTNDVLLPNVIVVD